MEDTSTFGGSPTVTMIGDDIGATHDGNGTVTIPHSFQTLDLGIIGPGERLEIDYLLTIESDIPSFAEGMFYEFSDPLTIDTGDPLIPMIEIVPEPATLALLSLAPPLVSHRRRRRG